MKCVLCGRDESIKETRADRVRGAYLNSDGTFDRGHYSPRLSADEKHFLATGTTAFCTSRTKCRERYMEKNMMREDQIWNLRRTPK